MLAAPDRVDTTMHRTANRARAAASTPDPFWTGLGNLQDAGHCEELRGAGRRQATTMTFRVALALVPLLTVLVGCQTAPVPSTARSGVLQVVAVAGPVCPVEQVPPDPECAPRTVADATVLVQPGDGRDIVVATLVTDAEGMARVELPAGNYVVIGAVVDGLMGQPQPVPVAILADGVITVDLAWDTGIR